MQRAYVKRNSKFTILALVFLLACTLLLSFLPMGVIRAEAAASDPFQESLSGVGMTVTAYSKSGGMTGTSKSFNIVGEGIDQAMTGATYQWKDVKYFKIEMSNLNAVPDVVGDYEYSYSVTYIPAVISADNKLEYDTAALLTATIYPTEEGQTVAKAQSKDGIKNKMYFFIDDNMALYRDTLPATELNYPMTNANAIFESQKEKHDYSSQGGWGVYVFSFNCGDGTTSGSMAYELLPTELSDLREKSLSIKAEETPSQFSISNAYIFSVNEDFQYINREYITWKIKGVGSDGTKYVLIDADKTADNETPLYQEKSIKRTGPSFKLDVEIQGTWTAEVIIDDGLVEDGTLVNKRTAVSEEVSTIKPFSTAAIIWIVTGVTVVAVGIVTAIIIVTIKKEKTW